jgi:hypothetical protein
MAVTNFKELLEHLGHDVKVVAYLWPHGEVADVAIECVTCNLVLISHEAEGEPIMTDPSEERAAADRCVDALNKCTGGET